MANQIFYFSRHEKINNDSELFANVNDKARARENAFLSYIHIL